MPLESKSLVFIVRIGFHVFSFDDSLPHYLRMAEIAPKQILPDMYLNLGRILV
jgi:hypothetical protein